MENIKEPKLRLVEKSEAEVHNFENFKRREIMKGHVKTIAVGLVIALGAIWLVNHVPAVANLVKPKAA